jgi:hypothetical protein
MSETSVTVAQFVVSVINLAIALAVSPLARWQRNTSLFLAGVLFGVGFTRIGYVHFPPPVVRNNPATPTE